jgi:hypothetical protein
MQRQRWFEIHDSPWFPPYLRDLVTQALEAVWNRNATYRSIAGRLRDAVRRSGAQTVVDLCSGGGGPWPALYGDVAEGQSFAVLLTDRSPSRWLNRRPPQPGLHPEPQPIDATKVPEQLKGFRTIFSSFHHFDPDDARIVLTGAFTQRQGIAVFEAARRDAKTMALLTGVPFLAWREAAAARPVRWGRILFTCILPVVPLVLWIDGVLSCLRSYSIDDLRELTFGLDAPDYQWQIGEQHGGSVIIRYLVGIPAVPGFDLQKAPEVADLSPVAD